jgi:hypothetical protein
MADRFGMWWNVDAKVAEVEVSMAGGTDKQPVYQALAKPVTLAPHTIYCLLSAEGNEVAYYNGTVLNLGPVATLNGSVYQNDRFPADPVRVVFYKDSYGIGIPCLKYNAINAKPSITLTSPTDGAAYANRPATITLTANATDTDGTISKVEFYHGATKIGEDTTAPYAYDWTNVPSGCYSLSAKAIDDGGKAAMSASVMVSVAGYIQAFTFTDVVGQDWTNELITSILTQMIPPGDRGNVTLLTPTGEQVPFQWIDGNPLKVAYLANLPKYGKSTYFLKKQTPTPPANPLLVETLANTVRISNGITGVEVPKANGTYQHGPVSSLRMRSGRWVGSSVLTLANGQSITGYTQTVTATGPVFAETECRYTFANGKTWSATFRVIAGEPVVLVDEHFNLADASKWELKLDTHLSPTHAFIRPTEGTGAAYKGGLGQNSVFPLAFDGSDPMPMVLSPWLSWWVQADVTFFGVFHCLPGTTYARNAALPGMERTPATPPGGADDDMLIAAAGHAGSWVDNIDQNAGTYCRVQASAGGALALQLPLSGAGRRWLLGATSVAASIVPDPQCSEPQRLMNKYCETSLQDVTQMQLSWTQDTNKYPNLLLTRAEVTAFVQQPNFTNRVDTNRDATTRDFKKMLMPVVAGQPYAGNQEQWDAFRQMIYTRLDSAMNWFRVGNKGWPSAMYGTLISRIDIAPILPLVDLGIGAGLFTAEERARILAQLAFLGYKLASPDYCAPNLGFSGNPNMATAWASVVGQLGCALYSHPMAPTWVNIGQRNTDDMLTYWQDKSSGAWLEAPHYQLVALQAIFFLKVAMKNAGFITTAYDERLARTTRFLAKLSTPPDPRFGNYRHHPPIGNTYQMETTMLHGILAKYYRPYDAALADALQWTWNQENNPTWLMVGGMSDLDFYCEFLTDASQKSAPTWASENLPGFGAVLRNRFDGNHETYLVYHQGNVANAHYDDDQGSFELWGKGRPLCLDWGYNCPGLAAYHNRMNLHYAGQVTNFSTLATSDYLLGAQSDHSWKRHILFVKDTNPLGPNYVLLCDETTGTGTADWHLWINTARSLETPVTVTGAVAHAIGEDTVNLDVWFAPPSGERLGTALAIEPHRYFPTVRGLVGGNSTDWNSGGITQSGLHLVQPRGEPLLTLLYPRLKTEGNSTYTPLAGGKGVKIVHLWGVDYAFLSPTPVTYTDGTVRFNGTVGVVQRRGASVTLTLQAAGAISYATAQLISEKPATVTKTVAAQPATVALTAPVTGQVFTTVPAVINMAAVPSEPEKTTKVEFYNGAVKLGEDTTPPYIFAWTNVPSGVHTLTANTCTAGGVVTSQRVTVRVDILPSVTLTAPSASQVYGAVVACAATATDTDGAVSKVEFYSGAIKIGEDTTHPYTCEWTGAEAGRHVITARAIDNDGGSATSTAVTIQVDAHLAGNLIAAIPTWGKTYSNHLWAGYRFTVGNAPITVTHLGRYHYTGNSLTHKVILVKMAEIYEMWWNVDRTVADVTVSMAGGTDKTPNYHALATPVTLEANATYCLLSAEGNEPGYDNSTILNLSSAVRLDGTVYQNDGFPADPARVVWYQNGNGWGIPTLKYRVNLQPRVTLMAPVPGTIKGSSVSLAATATDSDGVITKVEFYNGPTKIGEDSSAPYTFIWNGVKPGRYDLTAMAIDNTGGVMTSNVSSIVVVPPQPRQ